MKGYFKLAAIFGGILFLSPLLAGCKTTPSVDWSARVGNYTYDQAVVELGPPDKTAMLSTGEKVSEWIFGQRENNSITIGTGFFGGGYHRGIGMGMGVGQTIGGGYSDRVLRLTFGADNRLLSWSNNY